MKSIQLYSILKSKQPYLPTTVKSFEVCGIEFNRTQSLLNNFQFEGEKDGKRYYVFYFSNKLYNVSSEKIEANEEDVISDDMTLEEMQAVLDKYRDRVDKMDSVF